MNKFIKVLCKTVSILFLLTVLLINPQQIFAEVLINEFSPNTSSDWIELYSADDVDISGWVLDDYDTSTNMATIPDGVSIGPSFSNYYVTEVSTRLNKDGDEISLFDSKNNLKDKTSYGNKGGPCLSSDTGSIGRYPDGNSTIDRFSLSTKGETNDVGQLDPCPTPTPTPTPTLSPTPSPTSSSTVTPTPIPIPSQTKSPTASPIKTPSPTPTKTPTFAPEENSSEKPTFSPSPTSETTVLGENISKEKNILPYVLIIAGIVCLGFGGYFLYNRRSENS
ncbi:lamin tail domain-containing protein [Candidatus Woesebacteria bacterium]|nr:lamin tail domain-containing protein [Candidatus Woesebacteria bacterium]